MKTINIGYDDIKWWLSISMMNERTNKRTYDSEAKREEKDNFFSFRFIVCTRRSFTNYLLWRHFSSPDSTDRSFAINFHQDIKSTIFTDYLMIWSVNSHFFWLDTTNLLYWIDINIHEVNYRRFSSLDHFIDTFNPNRVKSDGRIEKRSKFAHYVTLRCYSLDFSRES